MMEFVDWSKEKSKQLKVKRGVSFEDIIVAIQEGGLLDVIDHPNQKRYAHQRIFIVNLHDYVYSVPFVEKGGRVFLKTIYPSRKYTKQYIEKGGG